MAITELETTETSETSNNHTEALHSLVGVALALVSEKKHRIQNQDRKQLQLLIVFPRR